MLGDERVINTTETRTLPEGIDAIRERYGNRHSMARVDYMSLITRPGYRTFRVESDGEAAYAVVKSGRLYDAAGHPDLLADLIGYITHDNDKSLSVSIGLQPDGSERMLLGRANSTRIAPTGMVRIHDLAGLLSLYGLWWRDYQQRFNSGSVFGACLEE